MISIDGHLMVSFGTMSWGIMFSGLSLNVKASLVFAIFMVSGLAWSASPYSRHEIKEVETSEEANIRDLREQEIRQLRIALGRRLPPNRKADLYFRLAEIYLEAYRSEFLLEGRVHEKRLEKNISD